MNANAVAISRGNRIGIGLGALILLGLIPLLPPLQSIVWASAVGILAYSFGHAAEQAIKTAGLIGLIASAVLAVGLWVFLRRRRKRNVDGDEGALVSEAQDAPSGNPEVKKAYLGM